MNHFNYSRKVLQTGATACLLLFASSLPSALFSETKLSDKSPFLPPGHGVKNEEKIEPQVQPQGPISRELEFRGIVQIGDVYQFSIFNKKDQKSYWLKENEAAEAGIKVSNYDSGSNSVVILMNGRSERITLETATDTPLPVALTNLSPSSPPPNGGRQIVLPKELQNNRATTSSGDRKAVPRRRVILPKKTN